MQARYSYEHLSVCPSVCLSNAGIVTKRQHLAKKGSTRKRPIAKALHLEGHPDFAPVDLAYYHHFLGFLFENVAFWEVPSGNHKCRSRGATPLVTLNKQQIRTDFAINLRCLLHML